MTLEGDTKTDFHNSATTVTQPENSTISDATAACTLHTTPSVTNESQSMYKIQLVRSTLESELDQVRNAMNKIEEKEKNKKKRKSKDTFHRKFNDSKSNRALEICNSILSEMLNHKYIEEFKKPVDVDNHELYDYHDFIEKPMDLGTVQDKLKRKCYRSPKEFAQDTRLTFLNAINYNAETNTTFHFMARDVLVEFNRIYAYQESQYNLKVKRKHNTRVILKKRDMTYEEKLKLVTNLKSLPQENLSKVVSIIKKRKNPIFETDNLLQVDADSLLVKTLWDLDRFILKCKRISRNNQRKALQETDTLSVPLLTAPANLEIPKETPVEETGQDRLSNSSSSSSTSNSDSS